MSLTDCPLLIILSVPYLESIVEIFSSDTPSSLPFWCWPGDRTDQTEIPPIDFFLINLRYQQQRKDGRSEGMELTASEGLTWLEAGWWNTRRVRSGVSGVTETRQFLFRGGSCSGFLPQCILFACSTVLCSKNWPCKRDDFPCDRIYYYY